MSNYIISVDQSTTATKAVLFNGEGDLLYRTDKSHRQITPQQGWVEHDGSEIYNNFIEAVKALVAENEIDWKDISVLAISNQRETVIAWDKETGEPVYNAVVWQCGRAEDICQDQKIKDRRDSIRQKTGLELSPYFSAPKLKWILDNVPGVRDKAREGKILAGTMDSFLVWKLTGGKKHITDYSNASRTMLLNLNTLEWDEDILELFEIPRSMMADIVYSDEIVGYTDFEGASDVSIPIAGIMGDSHGAMFAQNCYLKGMMKGTFGTGSSIMMNIGDKPILSEHGLVTSVAWGMKKGVEFVFEGNINYAAATVKWLVDDMEILENAQQSEEMAQKLADNAGVYIVPAFTGLGAPYWDSKARAIICGLSAGAKKEHIARAALESIAYQVKDIVDCAFKDTGLKLEQLRADGGPTKNKFLMQFLSDILDADVRTASIEELSAKGCALMAGLALGIWKNQEELNSLSLSGEIYKPNMSDETINKNCDGWKVAVKRARMEA